MIHTTSEPDLYDLNRLANKLFGRFFRSPNIRYYRAKKDSYAFAWTTSRANFNGKEGFWTLKYRVLANGTWRIAKAMRFSRRNVAKRRAYKWYQERQEYLKRLYGEEAIIGSK